MARPKQDQDGGIYDIDHRDLDTFPMSAPRLQDLLTDIEASDAPPAPSPENVFLSDSSVQKWHATMKRKYPTLYPRDTMHVYGLDTRQHHRGTKLMSTMFQYCTVLGSKFIDYNGDQQPVYVVDMEMGGENDIQYVNMLNAHEVDGAGEESGDEDTGEEDTGEEGTGDVFWTVGWFDPENSAAPPSPSDYPSADPIVLYYFKGWGLAEQIRWVLAAHPSTSSFTQVALSSHAEFQALKDSDLLMFDQLPLLQIDGLNLTQSGSIVRYLADRNGLSGTDLKVGVKIDMICEAVKDCRAGIVRYAFASDKVAHREEAKKLIEKWFPKFERMCVRGKWIAGGSEFSVADVLLSELWCAYTNMWGVEWSVENLGHYTGLCELADRIMQVAGVEEYRNSERRFDFPMEGKLCDEYVENVKVVLGRK